MKRKEGRSIPKKWIFLLLLFYTITIYLQQQSKENDTIKFLENLRQTIKELLSRQSRIIKHKLAPKKQKLKTIAREKIMEKLSTPFVLQPQHRTIIIKDRKQKTKIKEENKDFFPNNQYLTTVPSSKISKYLIHVFHENPSLIPFKLPDTKQHFNKLKNLISISEHQLAQSEKHDKQSTIEYMNALHEWFLDVLENVRKFWIDFKNILIDNENVYTYLTNNICTDNKIEKNNIFEVPYQEYLENRKMLRDFDSYSRLELSFYPLYLPSFYLSYSKSIDCNNYSFYIGRVSMDETNICKDTILLNKYGECKVGILTTKIQRCLAAFQNNNTNYNDECKDITSSLSYFYIYLRKWFRIAKKIYMKSLVVYIQSYMALENPSPTDNITVLLYNLYIKKKFETYTNIWKIHIKKPFDSLLKTSQGNCYADNDLDNIIEDKIGFKTIAEKYEKLWDIYTNIENNKPILQKKLPEFIKLFNEFITSLDKFNESLYEQLTNLLIEVINNISNAKDLRCISDKISTFLNSIEKTNNYLYTFKHEFLKNARNNHKVLTIILQAIINDPRNEVIFVYYLQEGSPTETTIQTLLNRIIYFIDIALESIFYLYKLYRCINIQDNLNKFIDELVVFDNDTSKTQKELFKCLFNNNGDILKCIENIQPFANFLRDELEISILNTSHYKKIRDYLYRNYNGHSASEFLSDYKNCCETDNCTEKNGCFTTLCKPLEDIKKFDCCSSSAFLNPQMNQHRDKNDDFCGYLVNPPPYPDNKNCVEVCRNLEAIANGIGKVKRNGIEGKLFEFILEELDNFCKDGNLFLSSLVHLSTNKNLNTCCSNCRLCNTRAIQFFCEDKLTFPENNYEVVLDLKKQLESIGIYNSILENINKRATTSYLQELQNDGKCDNF